MIQIANRIRSFIALIIMVGLPLASTAQTASDGSSAALVDKLAEQMAFTHQLGETPEQIRPQFVQNPLQLPPEKNQRMLEQFDDAYANNSLLNDFKTALNQELTGQQQKQISDWLEDRSTQIITEKLREFYTLQGKRKRVVTLYEMDQKPPSEQRKKLITTLTDNSSAAESSVESSVIILRSVIKALSALSENRNFSDAQIDAIADNFRSQIQAQSAQLANERLLVMYHAVETDSLKNYIDFWQTDTGQELDKAISRSRQAAYEAAADRFLESVKN